MKYLNRILYCVLLLLMVSFSYAATSPSFADTALLRTYLTAITQSDTSRSYDHVEQLDKIAGYIQTVFATYADSVSIQEYEVDGKKYRNIICSFGTDNAERIIIGAHYDVCGHVPGADDNASGVTALLELARMLKGKALHYRIDLVAYTLEEPPYFGTHNMGSYVHALSLSKNNAHVYGMICLEMIGYFSDKENSQAYPDPRLTNVYGNKGDYIALVTKLGEQKLENDFCNKFIASGYIKTVLVSLPENAPALNLSDNVNYSLFGYSALMITDTAIMRNKNYHASTDTLNTLDLGRMAKTIDALFSAVIAM